MNWFEDEYKSEFNALRAQWQMMIAQIELTKKLEPDKTEALEEYIASMKRIVREQALADCYDEEERKEIENELMYVFGERDEL